MLRRISLTVAVLATSAFVAINAESEAKRFCKIFDGMDLTGRHGVVTLNGHNNQDVNLDDPKFAHAQARPLSQVPAAGYIGLQSHSNRAEFRNFRIKVLKPVA